MSEDALSQTTSRALLEAAPFLGGRAAPRAEAAAALLQADPSALDSLSDAQIGALALATCGCLDRGTYSRAGTDEQKRRGRRGARGAQGSVVDSTERSKVVISALRGAVERVAPRGPTSRRPRKMRILMKRLRAGISRRRGIASIEVDLTGHRASCGERVAGWLYVLPSMTNTSRAASR